MSDPYVQAVRNRTRVLVPLTEEGGIEFRISTAPTDGPSVVPRDDTEIGICWCILEKQNKAVNSIGDKLAQAIVNGLQAVEELIEQGKIKLLIICSGKKDTFIVGADINLIAAFTSEEDAANASRQFQSMLDRWRKLKCPTVALINGACLGGGAEVGLACNYRIAFDSDKVSVGLPEVKLGLLPAAGGCVYLPRLIGLHKALKMILMGTNLSAQKALKARFLDHIIPNSQSSFDAITNAITTIVQQRRPHQMKAHSGTFLENNKLGQSIIYELTRRSLDKKTYRKYPAPYYILDTVIRGFSLPVHQALELEAKAFGYLTQTNESKSLVRLFLLQSIMKNKAREYQHQVLEEQNGDATTIQTTEYAWTRPSIIGVSGAGTMGSGIAELCLVRGFKVRLFDITKEKLDEGVKNVKELLREVLRRGMITHAKYDEILKNLFPTTTFSDLMDVEVLIEAAIENVEVKRDILRRFMSLPYPATGVIDRQFYTNTSSIAISDIINGSVGNDGNDSDDNTERTASSGMVVDSQQERNVVGFHFGYPVYRIPSIEIIRGSKTSSKVLADAIQLANALGKTPFVVNDCYGFAINRIIASLSAEIFYLIEEGYNAQHIEKVFKNFLSFGPLSLSDQIGLDIVMHVSEYLSRGHPQRFNVPRLLQQMVAAGYLGRKSLRGLYEYNPKTKKPLKISIPSSLLVGNTVAGNAGNDNSEEYILRRCILRMVNEAAFLLQENIVDGTDTLDYAVVFFGGFPPYSGGLLRYAETYWPDPNDMIQEMQRLYDEQVQKLDSGRGSSAKKDRFKPCPWLIERANRNNNNNNNNESNTEAITAFYDRKLSEVSRPKPFVLPKLPYHPALLRSLILLAVVAVLGVIASLVAVFFWWSRQ